MIVDLAVCVGAFVAALAGVNLATRNVYAMAREGGMPRPFTWTHPRFGSPWAAMATVIALTLALVLVLALIVWDDPFKYFGFMATTATFAILGAYILIALAGMAFFWRRRSQDEAFHIVFDLVLPAGAVAICGYTIYESYRGSRPPAEHRLSLDRAGVARRRRRGPGVAQLRTPGPGPGVRVDPGRQRDVRTRSHRHCPGPARAGTWLMAYAGVSTPELLERSEELAQIESALALGREQRGSFLVIEGPPGIGKTALIGAARASAEAAGMFVLRSRGAELEREFAFGIVRQLFEAPLAQAPSADRDDLLQGAAGMAASAAGLPRRRGGRRCSRGGTGSLFRGAPRAVLVVRELRRTRSGLSRRRRRPVGRLGVPSFPGVHAVPRRRSSDRGDPGRASPRGRRGRRAARRADHRLVGARSSISRTSRPMGSLSSSRLGWAPIPIRSS